MILKITFFTILICFSCLFERIDAVVKRADKVFAHWIDETSKYFQNIFDDLDIGHISQFKDQKQVKVLSKNLLSKQSKLGSLKGYLDASAGGDASLNAAILREHFCTMYPQIESDMPAFIKQFRHNAFSSVSIDKEEDKADYLDLIAKYRSFMKLLFAQESKDRAVPYKFAAANRFFEYCCSEPTSLQFRKLMAQNKYRPIGRFLISTIWDNLAGQGWLTWNENCLKALKAQADQGKTITYIAGGCDIYHLIKRGIYNIRIIDPMLPSQPEYYADEWLWFIKQTDANPGLGDVMTFTFGKKKILMKRTGYEEHAPFTAKLSTKKVVDLPTSKTTWTLYDGQKKLLGSVVFDRRFCNQDDFAYEKNRIMLLSFNELYFVTTSSEEDSWGIDPTAFDEKLQIFVKQLRRPIDKKIACNVRAVDNLSCSFIKWGTCAT